MMEITFVKHTRSAYQKKRNAACRDMNTYSGNPFPLQQEIQSNCPLRWMKRNTWKVMLPKSP